MPIVIFLGCIYLILTVSKANLIVEFYSERSTEEFGKNLDQQVTYVTNGILPVLPQKILALSTDILWITKERLKVITLLLYYSSSLILLGRGVPSKVRCLYCLIKVHIYRGQPT
jgi:hypothetical protein